MFVRTLMVETIINVTGNSGPFTLRPWTPEV